MIYVSFPAEWLDQQASGGPQDREVRFEASLSHPRLGEGEKKKEHGCLYTFAWPRESSRRRFMRTRALSQMYAGLTHVSSTN
jgi:hypothetical protein